MTDLSIVIPAFNEKDRIGETLDAIDEFVDAYTRAVEVIVVDDGSTDGTAEVVASRPRPPAVIQSPQNMGKGHAVRVGMLAARGQRRLFTDADNSTPMSNFALLDETLTAIGGSGVAFASIGLPESMVATPQRGLRPAAGRFGNRVIRALVLPGVQDSQRGFKLFSADVADEVFARCRVDGWGFDVEALALARKRGYPIAEVPVTWEHRDDSRVTAGSYLTTFAEIVGIRWRLTTGYYQRRSSHRLEVPM